MGWLIRPWSVSLLVLASLLCWPWSSPAGVAAWFVWTVAVVVAGFWAEWVARGREG